jgi:ribulose-phosphate 3-epimerase
MSRTSILESLRQAAPVVLPSLLLCDFGHLAAEVAELEAAGARALHLDVMDGRFVPNFTYGMTIVKAVRQATSLPLDVHMMIVEPAQYVGAFIDAGASIVTIHAEAVEDPRPVLDEIRDRGALASLAISPPTPVSAIRGALPHCDMILALSVMPGFGAQKFDPRALDKLRELRAIAGDQLLLEIDGGVNDRTAAECGAAGAQMLVAGAAIFRNPNHTYAESIADLQRIAVGGVSDADYGR